MEDRYHGHDFAALIERIAPVVVGVIAAALGAALVLAGMLKTSS